MPRASATALAVLLAALARPAPRDAAEPRIRAVECIAACADGQPRGGSLLLVSGTGLGNVYTAVFPGGRDGIRDLRGRAGQASTTTVRVRVPWEATSGTFVLGTRDGMVSRAQPVRIAPVPVVSRWSCLRQCAPGRKVKGGSLVLVRGCGSAPCATRCSTAAAAGPTTCAPGSATSASTASACACRARP